MDFIKNNQEQKLSYVEKRYMLFIDKYGYIPRIFDVYNSRDCKFLTPTLTANSYQGWGSAGTGLIAEEKTRITMENKESILIKTATKEGFEEAYPGDGIQLSYPDSDTRRGRVQSSSSSSLQCSDQQGTLTEDLRIRKLTPRECFRLQGWTDEYYEKAEFVNTKAQLYKQAGNGVTVNVIFEIAKYLKTEGDNE